MQLSKWILLIAAIGVFILVGLSIFPSLQNMLRTMYNGGNDTPIVAVGRALMPYILVAAIGYASFRIFKSRGQ
jgi:hypothetical protein